MRFCRSACPLLLSVLCLLVSASVGRAWEPINARWSTWCTPVPLSLNDVGSADLGANVSHTEVARAFADWQAVSCAQLSIAGRSSTSAQPGTYEGRSIIGWVESGWRHAPEAIGVTGTLATQSMPSCITEADMELNGVHYTWTTSPGQGARVNAYSIALHEGGHYLGLGHSNDRDATMYYAYQGGVDAIGADDRTGICSLYPSSEADCTTLGCPAGQQCLEGVCKTLEGDGSLCAPCQVDDDCGGPNDYCLSYPDEVRYCGRACSDDGDCPADNEFCARTSSLRQCARVNEDGDFDCSAVHDECKYDTDCSAQERCEASRCEATPVVGADLGETCAIDSDCKSGLCAPTEDGRVCSRTCDWLDAASCAAAGSYCAATATGTCGIGFCLAGAAGEGADAASCQRDTDCASLYCIEGKCRTPCAGNATALCPEGSQCLATPLSGCGACGSPKELGDVCLSFEECPDRLCAEEGDRTYCTKPCGQVDDCPTGFSCEDTGSLRICRPPVLVEEDAGTRKPRANDDRDGCGCHTRRPSRFDTVLLCILVLAALGIRRRA